MDKRTDRDTVQDWNELLSIIHELTVREGTYLWYRGQPDYGWGLLPSVQRIKGGNPEAEQYMATNFMIETLRLNKDAPREYDRARWLSLMQHYSLPTRLLDWSESPLIALYFALRNQDHRDKDAALWCINAMKLNEKMGVGRYLLPITYDSAVKYLQGAFDKKGYPPKNKIIACCGVGSDLRMYVQQSNFTIHDIEGVSLDELLADDTFLYKLKIPAAVKPRLLKELSLLGISEKTVFPDMEHISAEQKKMFG